MKKVIYIVFIGVMLFGCSAPSDYQDDAVVARLVQEVPVNENQAVDGFLPVHGVIPVYTPLDDAEMLNSIVMTLITPTLQSSVTDFYKPYLTTNPEVNAAYSAHIIDIFKYPDVEHFTVTVVVEPYVGAHVAVGKDEMQIDIEATGDVTVKEFKHLQSYDLPAQLQSLIKKALP